MAPLARIYSRFSSERGVTLMEMLIGVAVLSACVAFVGMPMFSVVQQNDPWREDLAATANWWQATGSLSRDASLAETISLGDGSPSTDSITLAWFTTSTQTVDYTPSGDSLLRTHNGDTSIAARGVTSVTFTRSGDLLTMDLVMDAGDTAQGRAALRRLTE